MLITTLLPLPLYITSGIPKESIPRACLRDTLLTLRSVLKMGVPHYTHLKIPKGLQKVPQCSILKRERTTNRELKQRKSTTANRLRGVLNTYINWSFSVYSKEAGERDYKKQRR